MPYRQVFIHCQCHVYFQRFAPMGYSLKWHNFIWGGFETYCTCNYPESICTACAMYMYCTEHAAWNHFQTYCHSNYLLLWHAGDDSLRLCADGYLLLLLHWDGLMLGQLKIILYLIWGYNRLTNWVLTRTMTSWITCQIQFVILPTITQF